MRFDQKTSASLAIAGCLFGAVPAQAQVAERFVQAQRENAAALKAYEWKSRVEVRQRGETRNVQLFLMRYGLDGFLQKTPIGGTPPLELPRRPLMRKVAEKRVAETKELVGDLADLARSYAHLPPDRLAAALGGADVIAPLDRPSELTQLRLRNVLRPGDTVTVWIDPATHQPGRMRVDSFLEGHPATVVSEFRQLDAGPHYVARVMVDYPSEAMQVVTENFDYAR